ncbi:MAG: radical SAM protein [Syntrophales bacterium]|nr:radical SAM protein [Syntrophales bacterium]
MNNNYYKIDPAFEAYFKGKLKQVFLYITDRCQIHCDHCLYKTTLANREIKLCVSLNLLKIFRDYGAEKLTLIGGEPTLYGIESNNIPLFELIEKAKEYGYKYIRLDSNGQFKRQLIENDSFRKIDNLSISIDGHTASVNDTLRGEGTFKRAIKRLKNAVSSGYYTTITSCIHYGNVDYIEDMISMATDLGVKEYNMHPLFKMGIERDVFTGNAQMKPEDWVNVYEDLREKIDSQRYGIFVRLPQRFVKKSEYRKHPDRYDYCPVRMGERILVHPNGEMRICALCIGSPYSIATYDENEINFGSLQSEIGKERVYRKPCMSQIKDFGDIIPICISYKPHQNEYVWVLQNYDEKFLGIERLIELR